jgi:hypothetical protein
MTFLLTAQLLHCEGFGAPRFPDNAAEELEDGAFIERPPISLARPLDHLALALVVAERKPLSLLRFPNFDGELRPQIQEPEQLAVNRVNLCPPIFNAHLIGSFEE